MLHSRRKYREAFGEKSLAVKCNIDGKADSFSFQTYFAIM